MRVLGGILAVACAACVDVAEHRATDPGEGPDAGVADPDPPVIARHPGATVRVEIDHGVSSGFASYAAVWLHHEQGQEERLAIERSGAFDWTIDRSGAKCEIAGTVVLATVNYHGTDSPALTWTMTLNNCNSSYQGRTASDIITEHSSDSLTIKDSEFDLAPVPYVREHF
jgi:hypothetical protein